MELPKHTTQVGTIPANKKLYLEDYCISYKKQLDDMYPEERKQIALFGTLQKEKNIEYAFVYGAALLGRGKGRTDSMTITQKEEAEMYRQKYFPDYQLLGLIIATDHVNEAVYWLGSGAKSIAIDGYYIFYDQNEVMLNFMMLNQSEERAFDMDPVIVKKADMDRERRERKEKEEIQNAGTYRKKLKVSENLPEKRKGVSFSVAAGVVLLAIIGVYGIRTYYPNVGVNTVKTAVLDWIGTKSEQTSSYLESTEMIAFENDVEVETDEMPVATMLPPAPADLDVVVIPELDALTNSVNDLEQNVIEENKTEEYVSTEGGMTESGELEKVETAETVQPEVITSKEPVKYLIQRGDNLLRILRTHYGDESKLQEICTVNNIKDPNNIQVGQTILLP